MFDIFLRNLKDYLIEPLISRLKGLKKYGVTPNHFTTSSLIFGLITIYYIVNGEI